MSEGRKLQVWDLGLDTHRAIEGKGQRGRPRQGLHAPSPFGPCASALLPGSACAWDHDMEGKGSGMQIHHARSGDSISRPELRQMLTVCGVPRPIADASSPTRGIQQALTVHKE